jgi:hypothetical protein
MIRQGDILLIPVTTIPTGTPAPPEHGRLVLAHGEATGHTHSIAERDDITLVTAGEADGLRMWLTLTAPAELEHPEHDTLTVPPGQYEVRRQREYRRQAIRRVSD